MVESLDRQQASYRVLVATLWLTLLVFMVKVWAGFSARSLSILAESLHTLIDSFSTLLSLMSVNLPYWLSKRSPWVHSKWETICALSLTAILGFTGCSLLLVATQQLMARWQHQGLVFVPDVTPALIQLWLVMVTIHLCMVVFERYEGRRLTSQALNTTAYHVFQHSWLTGLTLVGLIGIAQGWVWLDFVLTIVLLVASVVSLWQVLTRQLPLFVQHVAIAPEVIHRLACQIDGVVQCYNIRAQGVVGRQVHVELHLVLHPDRLGAARAIANHLEHLMAERYGPVCVVIHVQSAV